MKPGDIAVLAPDRALLEAIADRIGRIHQTGVTLETIRRFKGLERPVVIVAATRELADEPELAYVATSRARTHLVLVGEQLVLDWLISPLTSVLPHDYSEFRFQVLGAVDAGDQSDTQALSRTDAHKVPHS